MKKMRILAFAAALVPAAALSVGCSGTSEPQPQTSAGALARAPVGVNTRGPVKLMGEALGEVALRPEQRTKLEALAAEADARHASLAGGRKELMLAVADQVEKGAIDRAALKPTIDKIAADAKAIRPADAAALEQVHAILDKEQRSALVDALEDRMKEMRRGGHGRGHGKAHAGRAEGGPHARGPEGRGPEGGPFGFGRFHELAADLRLTDEQKDKIKETMKAAREARKDEAGADGPHERHGRHAMGGHMQHGKKALESFRGDDFKAAALVDPGGPDHLAEGSDRMLDLAERIMPILTPEQRKIAADKLRAAAARPDRAPSAR